MQNLDSFVKLIWAEKDVASKLKLFEDLINASHAKAETKKIARARIKTLNASALDKYAVNYAFAGEGMKIN